MTRSTEIVLSQSENRFLSERVESRVADFGSGPTADTFSAILAKLRRRMRGAVRLSEMEAARKARNFKASDALRAELTAAGILVENTKEGVRWRRK